MSTNALQADALELLAQISERQKELSLPAHLAVMEAFNLCAEGAADQPVFSTPRSADPIQTMLHRASKVLLELAQVGGDLGSHLRCFDAHVLLEVAIRES